MVMLYFLIAVLAFNCWDLYRAVLMRKATGDIVIKVLLVLMLLSAIAANVLVDRMVLRIQVDSGPKSLVRI
jgi:hypothetical protein